jgi:hypothetical protein
MAVDMTGYKADTTNTGPAPDAERLALIQASQNNQTINGQAVAAGSTVSIATGKTYSAGTSALNTPENSVRVKDVAKENRAKSDALVSMGFDPGKTTEEQFLSQPGMSQLYKEKINLFAYGMEQPTFYEMPAGADSVTSSSNATSTLGTLNQWAKDKAATTAGLATPAVGAGATAVENSMLSLIKGQLDTNQQYNQQLIDNIKAQGEAATKAQDTTNRLNAGQSAWQLAKMGALGTTMSGQSYLLSVQQAGQDKIASLAAESQSQILASQKAMNDGNYELSVQLLEAAQGIEDRITAEKQQQFENGLAAADEMRKAQDFQRQMVQYAQEDISNLVSLGYSPTDFSEQDKREYEASAGYPAGSFDKLYDVVKSSNEASGYAAQLEVDKKKYDILKDIPSDVEINIGGQMESGLKLVAPNIFEQVVTDANGNISIITFDENTKEMKTYQTGVTSAVKSSGGSSGGGGGYTSAGDKPVNAAQLTGIAQKLYYEANGKYVTGEGLAQMVNMLDTNARNDAAMAKETISAKQKMAFQQGASPASLINMTTDASLYNQAINNYVSDYNSNPFVIKTPQLAPEITESEVTEYNTKGKAIGSKITRTSTTK